MKKIENNIFKFDNVASCDNVEISVNGKNLPLKIGDQIDIGDNVIRVVMKIQVNEDSQITYGIQWLDGIEFKLEWFSWPELCYMSNINKMRPKVGI